MLFKRSIKITQPYRGSTKFSFWSDLQVDDVVEIHINYVKHRSYYQTLPKVMLKNTRTNETFEVAWNTGIEYLGKCKWVEL